MDQFVVKPLFGDGPVYWYTPTNVTLWMGIALVAIFALFVLATRQRGIIPSRLQSIAEVFYGFIHNMVEEVAGHDGVKYFPYVMTLFLFVLLSNLLGLLPMSFTTTSHVAVTASLAVLVFLGVTLIGISRKGLGFFGMFWVTSAPLALRPILAVIEIISYIMRPVSHSIRLAGNLLAGHAVLKVFAGFASMAIISPLAIAGAVGIYALEVLVAFVQAYVFTILTCVYLKDAVGDAHH
ncbi:F0F1 ATP synthase subunit A [Pseudogemmobacter faecipullorum]|uniref:ATP synthase subunit a n=1 Tax=Pseudogemmobacter faecipullorum TaxID=2755041 RepID=A0ABS8CP01_9RHOB|nr:F0F1 ATP synthase subunit A [Pseudogemmobacter faecipullorum]MCB5411127.1 F0F1 ATP synthase subunit A [Pseudogemmobacter faecipullorum]